ncbi:hypothetical protein BGW80DRAFT_1559596 [Lactifluus volemus]|nr:hypothetical protein BGW80DRAFT_1559596 [Lactifluus volemus]
MHNRFEVRVQCASPTFEASPYDPTDSYVLLANDMSKSLMWEGIESRLMPSSTAMALPHIRVHLYNPTGALKFSASLRAKHVATFRTLTELAALAAHPAILFLTLPRISRQAAVLHYRHRLDMYKRPEPKPVSWSASPSHSPLAALAKGGGIGWQ